MNAQILLVGVALPVCSAAGAAQPVEKVRAGTPGAPGLPEDLFVLPANQWHFGRQLWAGTDACTKDQCEGGYTSGDLAVSVERSKKDVRVIAGFRNCPSVAWNEIAIGDKASKSDTKLLAKRIKKVVGTAEKYCKLAAPAVASLDAGRLFPPKMEGK